MQVEIPNKLYFKIGEVADIIGVEAYVLRFWESEFPTLAPQKTPTGHRTYRRKDVETLIRIKELLYEKGYTITGARRQLQRSANPDETDKDTLQKVRDGLEDILTFLDGKT